LGKYINQRGYALLIVMLTIIIFLSLSAVFISASFNHVKQEKTVDLNNLAVVAAEMGIKKLHVELENELINEAEIQRLYILAEINSFNDNVNAGTLNMSQFNEVEKTIKQNITLNVAKKLNTILLDNCGQNEALLDDESFNIKYNSVNRFLMINKECEIGNELENVEVISDNTYNVLSSYSIEVLNDDLLIHGSFIGENEKNASSNLDFLLRYPLSDIVIINNQETLNDHTPTEPEIQVAPDFDEMFSDFNNKTLCGEELAFSQCIAKESTNLGNINHSKIFFRNPITFSSYNLSNLNSSSIYSDHSINFNNVKGLKNGSFYVEGNFVTNQFSGIDNLYIQIDGKIEINKNSKGINNTVIYTSNSFEVDHLDFNNSSIYTNELTINKHLNMSGQSKICVNGDVTFTQNNPTLNMPSGSEIYYTGTLKPLDKNKFSRDPKKIEKKDWGKYCNVINPYQDDAKEYISALESDRLNEIDVEVNYK